MAHTYRDHPNPKKRHAPPKKKLEKPEGRVDLRLKEIDVTSSLPEDAFHWLVPEGADVIPLTQLLKKTPS